VAGIDEGGVDRVAEGTGEAVAFEQARAASLQTVRKLDARFRTVAQRTDFRDFFNLGVEPQQVIPGQTEAADGWLGADTAMRPMPVVAVEPSGEFGGALV
jgi:hypothetical protein